MSTIVSRQRSRYRAKLLRPTPEVVVCANSSQVRRLIYMAMSPARSLPGRIMAKRLVPIAVAVALIGLAGILALALSNHMNSGSLKKPVYVTTLVLRQQEDCTTSHLLTGLIGPTKRSEMGFTRSGRLKQLHVAEGDCVEAGTLLAELDSSSLQAELSVAKTELKLAEKRSKTWPADQPTIASIKNGRVYMSESTAGKQESYASTRVLVEHWGSVVKKLEIQLEECQLRAPYKARVVKTHLSDGSIVGPERPVLNIVSDHDFVAKVPIPLEHVEQLGSLADYVLSIGNRKLTGNLKAVSPDVDAIRQTCDAVFVVPELSSVNAGAQVRMNLEIPTGKTGFRIPKTALQTAKDGSTSVLVVARESQSTENKRNRKSIANQQRVEVLQVLENELIVKGDVRIGNRIVAQLPKQLASGQEVWFSDRMQWLNEVWP